MMIMMFASSDHGERHVHQVCHFSPAIIVTRLKLTKKQKIIITVITNFIIIINYIHCHHPNHHHHTNHHHHHHHTCKRCLVPSVVGDCRKQSPASGLNFAAEAPELFQRKLHSCATKL